MRLLEEYTAEYGNSSVAMKAWLVMPSAEEPDLLASSLRVDVTSTDNFPEDIFVWERMETMLDNGEMWDTVRAVCVAKPSDLSVYPAKAAAMEPNGNPPYYRDNFVQFRIESPDILLSTWALIKNDVSNLIKTVVQLGGP